MGTAPYFAYGATALTDNEYSLEALHSSTLRHNDIAVVVDDNKIYFYQMKTDSGETHNSPYVVKPIDESNDKRWHLISQEIYTTDIIQLVGNYVQTGRIKAISGQQIQIQASNGQIVRVNTDGTVTFPSYVIMDTEPTDNNHLTNKLYVDTEINTAKGILETQIDDRIDNVEDEIETALETYTDTEMNTLKGEVETYTDNETTSAYNSLELYVDNQIGNIEGNLENYADDEILNVVTNVYPVQLFELTTWTLFEGLYYSDITHNKGNTEIFIRCWNDDGNLIFPEDIVSININTTRIWMPTNTETLKVVIL